ncbi:hypothetical protein LSTR_LSTR013629 [Laodelphax striatellus]|uniref:Doublecortin domain-containing protein n=1 Tax=Laodelphax striatellus TaxID=195883 RepID=A0A482Y0I1_LAOST|nr:hypothetical protein LSTR_LSTR013629 [Laodelphax striatellus]
MGPPQGGGGGWGPPRGSSMSRKASLADGELPPPGGGVPPKTSSGRVIRIINNLDHTIQCRVLLNLRTSQPFEEVLEDLGQVLKMNGAKRMYTIAGQEVKLKDKSKRKNREKVFVLLSADMRPLCLVFTILHLSNCI